MTRNRLSPSVRMASSINEFRKQLKTELFRIYISIGLFLTFFFFFFLLIIVKCPRDDLDLGLALYQVGLFTLHYITLHCITLGMNN